MSLTDPPRWTSEEFDEQRELARQIFRSQRLNESQGVHSEMFAQHLAIFWAHNLDALVSFIHATKPNA
ncbi:hypothetical protein [Candidatus Poriferisocius sp.]|uniref:hypothetical protein n=1 Tax=Candidatus Poriferisocius sp. TaxID=3101276 RepID=UPI003B01AFFA